MKFSLLGKPLLPALLLFAVFYPQSPLYTDNQNTKFLHGAAHAGWGHLGADWTANTLDPLPGAVEFVDWLRERFQVIILSDTFYEFSQPLMRKLGWPALFCHRLEVDPDGKMVDYLLRQRDQKRQAVLALKTLYFRGSLRALLAFRWVAWPAVALVALASAGVLIFARPLQRDDWEMLAVLLGSAAGFALFFLAPIGPLRRRARTPRFDAELLRTPAGAARYVVIDTELTGLDERSDAVLSIGGIGAPGGRLDLSRRFYREVRPSRELDARSILVHGITPSDVRDKPPVGVVLEEFLAFVAARTSWSATSSGSTCSSCARSLPPIPGLPCATPHQPSAVRIRRRIEAEFHQGDYTCPLRERAGLDRPAVSGPERKAES